MKVRVCRKDDLQPGEMKEYQLNGKRVLVCCANDTSINIVSASCPHEGAEMVGARMLEGTTLCSTVGDYQYGRCNEIIRCPWHGYEFDVKTGQALFQSEKMKLKSYDVLIEDEYVFVEL